LFYVDFTEYSINLNPASAGAVAGRGGECVVRLGLDMYSAIRAAADLRSAIANEFAAKKRRMSRRAGHDPITQFLIHDLDRAVDLGIGQVKLM
jgi:hypothetical protein